MDSNSVCEPVRPPTADVSSRITAVRAKLVIVGGFAVGKTTLIGSVSEIRPLRTEESLTRASEGVDDIAGVEAKKTTTLALDYGRITLRTPSTDIELCLFGAPGQDRLVYLWEDLFIGAWGVVVLLDIRRVDECFDILGELERLKLPFIAAINAFPDAPTYPMGEVREALGLDQSIPIVSCDARDKTSSTQVLIALLRHLLPPTQES